MSYCGLGRPRALLGGVCLFVAEELDAPIWLARIAALLLLVTHGGLAIVGYVVGWYFLAKERSAPPRTANPADPWDAREAALNRAFRDLNERR